MLYYEFESKNPNLPIPMQILNDNEYGVDQKPREETRYCNEICSVRAHQPKALNNIF